MLDFAFAPVWLAGRESLCVLCQWSWTPLCSVLASVGPWVCVLVPLCFVMCLLGVVCAPNMSSSPPPSSSCRRRPLSNGSAATEIVVRGPLVQNYDDDDDEQIQAYAFCKMNFPK